MDENSTDIFTKHFFGILKKNVINSIFLTLENFRFLLFHLREPVYL